MSEIQKLFYENRTYSRSIRFHYFG